ncbi:flagellar biosynthesis protein FlgM [bacterium]|nr:flagellar biosynthesis protein FlgM [bacterium]
MLLPNIWGQGAIFAFSGLDGETSYKNDLVGTLLGDEIGILFHLKNRRKLVFNLPPTIKDIDYKCVSSDIIIADFIDRRRDLKLPFILIFSRRNLLVGETSNLMSPQVVLENGESIQVEEELWLQVSEKEYTALCARAIEDEEIKFAFSYSDNLQEAILLAKAGVEFDIEEEIDKKLAFFKRLPKINNINETVERTFYKCFSVLKANIMSGEGKINRLWTTPDRVPHRNMWLWDSVFHSFALVYIDPNLALSSIEAVLDTQLEDGFIPHMSSPYVSSNITQPPLLAWGLWRIFEKIKDKGILERNYCKLKKYVEWNLKNRDENRNYLFEWYIEDNPLSRCGESGMDNSPRFDKATPLDAIDFSSFMANEARYLAMISDILNYRKEKIYWEDLYEKIKEGVDSLLWDDTDKFYYDRDFFGNLNKIKTVASFTPLFAGIADREKAKALIDHLLSRDEFNTEFPIPSVARSELSYSTDLWRGATWVNYNYLVILGLKEYGFKEIAEYIIDKTIREVSFWYKEEGVIFEYFDSSRNRSPAFLDRKGPCKKPYDIRRKIFPIRDYGWTASIFITLLMEGYSKSE